MLSINHLFLILLLLCDVQALYADWGDIGGQFSDTFSSIGDGFKSFGEGMAESFGMSPPGYSRNAMFVNNADVPITFNVQRLMKFQGMLIKKGTVREHTLSPYTHTADNDYADIGLYHQIHFRDPQGHTLFSDEFINLIKKHDPAVYYYHAYSNEAGAHIEYLGPDKVFTSEFSGKIFNSLQQKQTLTFTFDKNIFKIDLDPLSHNILQSDISIPNSLRPASGVAYLDFGTAGKITLAAEGLGNSVKDSTGSKVAKPMQATYKIFQVGSTIKATQTGYGPGTYDQVSNQRVLLDDDGNPKIPTQVVTLGPVKLRNITPVKCMVWNQSVDQITPAAGTTPFTFPQSSVWVVYSANGWSNTTKNIQNTVMCKIPAGQALSFYIIRPPVDSPIKLTASQIMALKKFQDTKLTNDKMTPVGGIELPPLSLYADLEQVALQTSAAFLYVISVDTDDDLKAQTYLQRLLTGKIAFDVLPTLDELLKNQLLKIPALSSLETLLAEKKKCKAGLVEDTVTGVTGTFLVTDIFTPYGESHGPYYYTVSPPTVVLSSYITQLTASLSETYVKSLTNSTALEKEVANWLTTYTTQGIAAAQQLITAFLQAHGVDALYQVNYTTNEIDRTQLSPMGNQTIQMLSVGPNGIVHMPVLWSHGINYAVYLGNKKPVINGKSAWNPSKTIDLSGQEIKS